MKKIEDMMVTSTFGLSIPLAQSCDRIWGTDSNTYIGKLKREKEINKKPKLFVNLKAVIYSVIASVEKEYTDELFNKNYQNEIKDRTSYETDIILALANNSNVDLTIFKSRKKDYDEYPFVDNRQAKTKSARTALLTDIVFDSMKRDYEEIPKGVSDALIITSKLTDLIYVKPSCSLVLLHTGKEVKYKDFNTRLHPPSSKSDMSTVPFNETTLKVFADKGGKLKKVLSSKTRVTAYKRLIGLKINQHSSATATKFALKEFVKQVDKYISGR